MRIVWTSSNYLILTNIILIECQWKWSNLCTLNSQWKLSHGIDSIGRCRACREADSTYWVLDVNVQDEDEDCDDDDDDDDGNYDYDDDEDDE